MRSSEKKMAKEISQELKLPLKDVAAVMRHQWEYLERLMKSGSFLGVFWPVLGQFVARKSAIRSMILENSWSRFKNSAGHTLNKTVRVATKSNAKIDTMARNKETILNQFDI